MKKRQSDNAYIQANLSAWDEVAPIHARHNQSELLERVCRPRFSVLDDTATAHLKRLGVNGKSVAQVCCNNGVELLSCKTLGAARCVGFDGAQGFVDQGNDLAKAAGKDVEFVCCEAHEIPREYHSSFDIVMITIGVLSWMPDIDRFFSKIEKLLAPDGVIFIYEHHSILMMFEPGHADDPINWELSYFRKEAYIDDSGLDYYGGESYQATPNASFSHKMSDIVMGGINSGLTLEYFEELPKHISNAWWNVEHSGIGLPMSFVMVFRITNEV
ncbi:class I SAM-dependent methyltransferase [Litoreibacter janthinus]|uniref:Methyltransferase domain-containing protein n=1 Tax=Litoreibacter janthinus TaxID=670154 RepID=A0A1I6G3P3_9RHOB|nr:class I SAM-dependent methyltransferase [Litoreibacter janthinus]SFR36667.1 Methyltransferase domain-containing protein [Litoreibacter janthinus]